MGRRAGPSYAPDIAVAGVAAAAPASDLPALLDASDDKGIGRFLSAYVVRAYAGAYPEIDADALVRREARWPTEALGERCMAGAKLLVGAVLASRFVSGSIFTEEPSTGALGARLRENVPVGPIEAPLLIVQGEADDLVLEPIQSAYVAGRCAAGQSLTYRVYPERDHLTLVAPGSPAGTEMLRWTEQRFAGAPHNGGCDLP